MREIIFIITDDDIDGGYTAQAHWPRGNRHLFTQGDNREELLKNIREAVDVSFEGDEEQPDLIHLQFVRDEIIPR